MVNRPLGELGEGSDAELGEAGTLTVVEERAGLMKENVLMEELMLLENATAVKEPAGEPGLEANEKAAIMECLLCSKLVQWPTHTTLPKEAQLFEPSREMREQSFVIQNALDSDQIIMEHGSTWLKSKKRIQ